MGLLIVTLGVFAFIIAGVGVVCLLSMITAPAYIIDPKVEALAKQKRISAWQAEQFEKQRIKAEEKELQLAIAVMEKHKKLKELEQYKKDFPEAFQ